MLDAAYRTQLSSPGVSFITYLLTVGQHTEIVTDLCYTSFRLFMMHDCLEQEGMHLLVRLFSIYFIETGRIF